MKKFLSLVLALALTMSLVVIPANAGESVPTLTVTTDISEVVATGEVKLTATLTNKPSGTITYKWSYQTGSAGKKDIKTIKNSSNTATYTWTVPKTAGTYTIKCVAKKDSTEVEDTCTITVVNNDFAMKSTVSSAQKKLKGDGTCELADKVYLNNTKESTKVTEDVTYTYKSSDTDVVIVDDNGKVSAVGNGSATVTVTAKYLGKSYPTTVKFTAETLSVSAGSVANGSSFGISSSTLKSDIAKKIKSFESLSSTPKVQTITIDGTVSNGGFYTKSSCKDAFAGGEMPTTLYFKANAGFLGTTSFTANVETQSNGPFEVTVTIDITSKGEIKDSVYATKADSDVDFKVKYTELYVYDGSDSFKDSMYKEYGGSDWDSYDKGVKFTVEEDEFSNGKCVKYVVALDSKDVASTGTITVYQKAYEIKYSGIAGETVTFEHDDFVSLMKEIAYDEDVITSKTSSKITLNDVDFELPSSSDGVLYYNGAKMTSSTTCKDMDKVTFTIGKNVKDTVSIDFTINATDSDKVEHGFNGTVVVSVVHEDIKYTNAAGAVVTFKASDFEDFFTDEYSKGELDYIKFDKLPTTLEGVLYASYNTLYTGALAKTSDKFYYDADSKTDYEIGDVVFKGANLTATSTKVYIPFTAYGEDKNDDDVEVSGWVVITVAPQRVMNFTDVLESNTFYSYIKYCYSENIMQGKSTTLFKPTEPVTRAQLVVTLYRMANSPTTYNSNTMSFTDCKTLSTEFQNAIKWGVAKKLINGYGNTFKPNDSITRQAMVTILYRFGTNLGYIDGYGVTGSLNRFSDAAKISASMKDAVAWAVGAGLVSGNNGKFNPAGTTTRGACAKILAGFHETYVG